MSILLPIGLIIIGMFIIVTFIATIFYNTAYPHKEFIFPKYTSFSVYEFDGGCYIRVKHPLTCTNLYYDDSFIYCFNNLENATKYDSFDEAYDIGLKLYEKHIPKKPRKVRDIKNIE